MQPILIVVMLSFFCFVREGEREREKREASASPASLRARTIVAVRYFLTAAKKKKKRRGGEEKRADIHNRWPAVHSPSPPLGKREKRGGEEDAHSVALRSAAPPQQCAVSAQEGRGRKKERRRRLSATPSSLPLSFHFSP